MNHLKLWKLWAALALVLCLAAPVFHTQSLCHYSAALAEAKTVRLNMTEATVYNSQSVQLKLMNAKDGVTWKSSDKKVAVVNSKGKVTGKKAGTVTITAVSGDRTYNCKVTVKSVLAVRKKNITISTGKWTKLDFWFYVDGYFNWKISNPKLLLCDWSGKWTDGGDHAKLMFYGLKSGSTTVRLSNDKTSDVINIKINVTGKTASPILSSAKKMTLSAGKSKSVDITSLDGGDITYDIDDEDIASCEWGDWDGNVSPLRITGEKAGTTTVTVTHDDTGRSVRIKVTVKAEQSGPIKGEVSGLLGTSFDSLKTRLRNCVLNGDTLYNDKIFFSKGSDGKVQSITLIKNDSDGEYTICGAYPGDKYYTVSSCMHNAGFTSEDKIGGKYTGRFFRKGQTVQVLPGMKSSITETVTTIILSN